MTLKTIFQDSNLLVIDKPAGLVVDRSETQQGSTMEDLLREGANVFHLEGGITRSGIVHRLDKDTSGIILVAKTTEALENLQSQFQNRTVKKEYLALTHGLIEEPGKVEGDIGRNPGDRTKFTVISTSKESKPTFEVSFAREAVTEYNPEQRLQLTGNRLQEIFPDFNKIQMRKLGKQNYGRFTLVRCFPKTGRTHQIRVHLKLLGHPLVADEKYVGRKMYRLDHRWCPRQFLHAAKIGFMHPESGKWMEFELELPSDLKKSLSLLTDLGRLDNLADNAK